MTRPKIGLPQTLLRNIGGQDVRPRPGAHKLRAMLLAAGIAALPAPLLAQPLPDGPPAAAVRGTRGALVITSGTGQLVQLPGPATSVVAADPRVARVQPLSPTSLFVMGLATGRTTLIATTDSGAPVAQFDVTVRGGSLEEPAASAADTKATPQQVQAALRQSLRTAAGITVAGTPVGMVLSGTVRNAAEAEQITSMAKALAGDKQPVVNNLAVQGAIQVNVRVRIAEISRNISRELGFSWTALGSITGASFGLQTASAVQGLVGSGGQLGARGVGRGFDINPVVDALASDQLISLLAEPNLTALSGETASFLVGGEFPIPVAGSKDNTITVVFKQYGVSLAFTPTVLSDDRLNIKVKPEVSAISNVGAVSLPYGTSGASLTVPGLTVRRADTTVELSSGQSFAIAGLLQSTTSQVDTGTNWLMDIPVLGALFKSDQWKRGETELVIIVTPYLVRPPADQSQVRAPTDTFRPATDLDRILYQRQVAHGATVRPQVPLNAGFILE